MFRVLPSSGLWKASANADIATWRNGSNIPQSFYADASCEMFYSAPKPGQLGPFYDLDIPTVNVQWTSICGKFDACPGLHLHGFSQGRIFKSVGACEEVTMEL